MRKFALMAAMASAVLAAEVPAVEAQPGEGKKRRIPKPTQEFEQGPMTRQQRRYAERQAKKGYSI